MDRMKNGGHIRYKKFLYLIISLFVGLLVLSVFSLTLKNETNQKTTNESKIINLKAEQFIINEKEVKEIIGNDWKINDSVYIDNSFSFDNNFYNGIGTIYSNNNSYERYYLDDSNIIIFSPVYISILTFPNIKTAQEYYNSDISIKKYTENGNKVNIGDNGYASTVNDIIKVIFIKNNVISIIYLTPNKNELLNVDQAFQLAKKQDEKLSRILEIIQ